MGYVLNPFTGDLDNAGSPASTTPTYELVYIGTAPAETDGNWRFTIVGNDLSAQRREGGVWVEKSSFLA